MSNVSEDVFFFCVYYVYYLDHNTTLHIHSKDNDIYNNNYVKSGIISQGETKIKY